MATYYVDDGGDGTTESSWATADTSINDLDTEYALASNDVVYFGHNMQCQATNAANLTITGPASGAPVIFISATQGSSPPTYAASTTNQIDTSEGAYSITLDGSFALYGMSVKSGADFKILTDNNETGYAEDLRVQLGANATFRGPQGEWSEVYFKNLTVDLSADGTTNRTAAVFITGSAGGVFRINGLSFVNAAYRTGVVFYLANGGDSAFISGADFSGFTNGTACEIADVAGGGTFAQFSHCLTAATWTPIASTVGTNSEAFFVNVGPANNPTYLYHARYTGAAISTTAIYRTGGATVESVACAWLVTTNSGKCSEGSPYESPWIYGTVASTGSKTFDCYITNDTADFTDAEVWLEVEYLGTADEANTALASDHRTITTTAAAQTDDTTSTWNGTGPSFTYKQKLSVTATVNETGMYRARVCVGLASIASSRYFYVDPAVAVS